MAALGGARSIEGVDLDEKAIAVARENQKLNQIPPDRLSFRHGDLFEVLRGYRAKGRNFSLMVLDPSKQARTRQELDRALRNYHDLNRLALGCLKPGGLLLTCSCSGLVSEEAFLSCLKEAAREARADPQVLHLGGAAPDHPFLARMPEGRYLKTVLLRIRPKA
jgi:23S rRNA (cytosine1962-C5)-methyltransferase